MLNSLSRYLASRPWSYEARCKRGFDFYKKLIAQKTEAEAINSIDSVSDARKFFRGLIYIRQSRLDSGSIPAGSGRSAVEMAKGHVVWYLDHGMSLRQRIIWEKAMR